METRVSGKCEVPQGKHSPLFEIALVLMGLDRVASFIRKRELLQHLFYRKHLWM